MKKLFLFLPVLFSLNLSAQFCLPLHAQYNNQNPNGNMFGLCKGDFDGDGILDLAVTNDNSGSVTTFKGFGGGNFGISGVYPVGPSPQQIICADFNNDGKPDLATANFGASNFSVLLNSGVGTFPSFNNFFSGSAVKSITSADFNNDGKMDIAVVNSAGNSYSAFLGDGTGSFILSQNSAIGNTPYGICSGDFDKDGNQDLVTVNNGNGQAQFIKGTGTGTFLGSVGISIFLTSPYDVTAADLNADGNLDVVIADAGQNTIEVVYGNGSGGFTAGPSLSVPNGPRMAAVGDLNNDGKVDLACPIYNAGDVSLFEGLGGGFGGSFVLNTGNAVRTAVIGDFNNDGLNDLAVTQNNANNNLYIYLNDVPKPVVSGTNPICSGSSTQLILTGADTCFSGLFVSTKTVVVNPPTTTVYTFTALNNGCSFVVPGSYTLNVNPLPNVIANVTSTFVCPGSSVIFTGGGASSYSWTGGVVNGAPYNVTGAQTFTVTGTDANNCSNTATVSISLPSTQPPAICQTTVDSLSLNNVIVWDKTLFQNADTFYIYRDTANNNYALIATIPYGSLSQYSDTARSIGAVNGDPNITTYRYKLAYRDSCGTMSALSPYHNTIYNYNISSLFLWNQYEIEGQSTPVAGLSNYVLKRDNVGQTGNYVTAATAGASSTSINDPQYGTYQTQADWRVETIWNITCTPTARMGEQIMGTIVKSKSNITNNRTTDIIKILNQLINVYPNPSQGNLNLHFNSNVTGKVVVKVYSPLGNEVYSNALVNPRGDVAIDLSSYQNGVYLLQMITDAGTISKRVIKN